MLPDVPTFDPSYDFSPSRITQESTQHTPPYGIPSRTIKATKSPQRHEETVYTSQSVIGFSPDLQRSPQAHHQRSPLYKDPRQAKELSPGGYFK